MFSIEKRRTDRDRGFALIVALIVLILLSIIGLAGMSSGVWEERMAGNAREHNTAFQAAETVLREAERKLNGVDPLADFTPSCTNARCAPLTAPDWRTYAWDGSKDALGEKILGLAYPPRYFNELVGEVKRPGVSGGVGYAVRISARATGAREETQVMLQSVVR